MTTAIDDRLTDLLARSAAAVEVRPDLDAVTTGDGRSPVVDLGRRPRDTRRLLALAAAVTLVLGLAGAAVVVTRDDRRPLAVTPAAPPVDHRFPVFGHLPAALDDVPVEANDGEGTHQSATSSTFRPDTPLVAAAIGRVGADGAVDDVVVLMAGAESREERVGPPPGELQEVGAGYRMAATSGWVELYGPGTTVVVVGGPQVSTLVQEIAGTGLTATVGPDGRPVLTLGDLPDGYTVTAPPAPPEDGKAEIAIDSEGVVVDGRPLPPYVLAETGVGAPSLAVAGNSAGQPYRPVEVDGSPGYVSATEDRTVVAWTAPNGVTLRLITDLEEDEALRVARGITLVDEAEWRSTYPEGPADGGAPPTTGSSGPVTSVPATSADHPLVGQPAPAVEGTVLGPVPYEPPQDAGEWTIVSFTASWCTTCLDLLDDLDAVHRPLHAEGRASVVSVFVDDTVETARTVVDQNEVVWQALVARPSDVEPWGVEGWPTTVFVDPDGIVQQVLVGSAPAPLIEEILTDLGG